MPNVNKVQVAASAKTTHEMLVAVGIMGAVGILLTIVAGQSRSAGNWIAGFLMLMLFMQGVTHINPFVSFLANHPLVPPVSPSGKTTGTGGSGGPASFTMN